VTTTAFGVAAAAASVLLLCACGFSRDEPVGPSDADIAASVQARLDRQWELSDLEGIIVRPETTFERIVSPDEWGDVMSECMHRAGIHSWGYNSQSGLFVESARVSASDQLAFYWCFASFPTIDLLSAQQLDYIYDYYAHWLTPCLEANGYAVMNAPTRKAFRDASPAVGRWNPYSSLEEYPATPGSSARLRERCAPTLPGIEGWSEG
jgi:hypothetical protein